jgi:hypothetical protein
MLLSTTKLFFKSPGEMQPVLGRVYETILKNYHDVDLRERAMYFYTLMQQDISLAEKIICEEKISCDKIYNEMDGDYLVRLIYLGYNLLSI